MIQCQICGKEFTTNRKFSGHLKSVHHMTLEGYYLSKLGNPRYCYCGNPTKFINIESGYAEYCSVQCCNRDPKRQIQIKNAMQKKYGVDNPSQVTEVKEKKKQTLRNNYGVDSPLQSSEIKRRFKATCIKNYGVDHFSKTKIIQDKIEKTMMGRYGVRRPLQSDEFKEKVKATNLQRYGTEFAIQSPEKKEKRKQTNLRIRGVKCSFQSPEVKTKISETCIKRYGVAHYSQSYEYQFKSRESHLKTFFKKLVESDRLKNLCIPKFALHEYDSVGSYGTGGYILYPWICKRCGIEFQDHLLNGHLPRCPKCYPKKGGSVSHLEKDVLYYVEHLVGSSKLKNNVVGLLDGRKELDIYIPSHNLAIEFNGIYWHSELNGKDKNYHLNKTLECHKRGIQLIHIFEDEWIDKQEIVKSIIRSKLGITQRIYARKCSVRPVNSRDASIFLFDNHIQGDCAGSYLGLYYKDALVAILSTGRSRFSKTYQWEILRYCSVRNTTIVGGLSRLIKNFIRRNNPSSIITYADRRFGEGDSYVKCGFNFSHSSTPGFFYLDPKYINRHNRLRFQKHLLKEKLETFDPNLTEWQNMQLSGYDRIWDCGSNVYVQEI